MDKDPTKKEGEFEDLSAVEKYEMSTEDYSKRTGKSQAIGFVVQILGPSMQGKSSLMTVVLNMQCRPIFLANSKQLIF